MTAAKPITLKPANKRRLMIQDDLDKLFRGYDPDEAPAPIVPRKFAIESILDEEPTRARNRFVRTSVLLAIVLLVIFATGFAIGRATAPNWDNTYGAFLVPVCEPFEPGHPGYEE